MNELRVLTGLDEWMLHDIYKNGVATFELIGMDNVKTAMDLKKGDLVMLTYKGKEDIGKNLEGIVAQVLNINTGYKKTLFKSQFLDERELLCARIQLKYVEHANVRSVRDLGVGQGMLACCTFHKIIG